MSITTEMIKTLRAKTGAGVLDCRKALEEAQGDMDKAAAMLREKGLAAAARRAGRETRNGVIDLYNHGDGRVGVMVEVNCETDFVARTETFRTFAHEVALQVAAAAPRWLDVDHVPPEVVARKKARWAEQAKAEGKPEHVIERIVEGRLKKFYQETCLLQQTYIRDDEKTVEDLRKEAIAATGENIVIRRFARWEVGEDLGEDD
jgi:elongation factor Ts